MIKFDDIIFTLDDGPNVLKESIYEISSFFKNEGIINFIFFWNGYHFFKKSFLKSINVIFHKTASSIVYSEKVPHILTWRDVIEEVELKNFLNQDVLSIVRNDFENAKISINNNIGYHGIFHPPIASPSHQQFFSVDTLLEDINFFEKILENVFETNVRIKFGRPPGGAGFDLYPERKKNYKNMLEVQKYRNDFSWNLWKSSSKDWSKGYVDIDGIINKIKKDICRNPDWESKKHNILFHSCYFKRDIKQIKELISTLRDLLNY
ncbi:hypothetical protein MHK_010812 [Candidatus Magnetomorum sp. HK-1]|nr:hypothetical protein MHK_010812 [Candidatus Magnetomorum sp. HK-1]